MDSDILYSLCIMSRSLHRIRDSLLFVAFASSLLTPLFSQAAPSLPSWLESYPGATPTVRSSDVMIESSYTSSAQPAAIVEFYSGLFGTAGVRFQPNSDGLGTSIRAVLPECELLMQIRSRAEGTFVKVTCSAKSPPRSTSAATDVNVIASHPQFPRSASTGNSPVTPRAPPARLTTDEFMRMHQQKVAELGIHAQHQDAPPPPLLWPSWLVNVNGTAVRAAPGVDQAKDAMLKTQYTTNSPMTEIYAFYRELLNAHDYPARSRISTGQTISGIQQNAHGYVEGSNYPDGAPGARSEIHVAFSRSVLNGPITVTLRFTTHEYIASRGY